MKVTNIFSEVQNLYTRYNATVGATMARYRRDLETEKQRCSQYKDESGELRKAKEALTRTARAEILQADQGLQYDIQQKCKELRGELSTYLCKQPSGDFIGALKVYRDFGVKMSKAELEGLVLQADGNYLALRALQVTAKDSGFDLSAPDAAAYSGFVDRLEKSAKVPMMYAPSEYFSEALDVLPDKPWYVNGNQVGTVGRPDSIHLSAQMAFYDNLVKKLPGEAEKWSVNFVPEISELKEVENDAGKKISPAQQRETAVKTQAENMDISRNDSENSATEFAKTRAESMEAAKAVMAHYVR